MSNMLKTRRTRVTTPRARGIRMAAVAVTGVTAAVLGVASLAWACGTYVAPPTVVTNPDTVPASSEITVKGLAWTTEAVPVKLALMSKDLTTVIQPLGTAAVAADQGFLSRVTLGNVPPGVYYVTAEQDGTKVNSTLEITGNDIAKLDPQWAGLAPGSQPAGIANLVKPKPASGSGIPMAPLAVGGGVLLAAGAFVLVEVRRKRAVS